VDDRLYRLLKYTAIAVFVLVIGVLVYGQMQETVPGDHSYAAGNRSFEDGNFTKALAEYDAALEQNPRGAHIVRAKARTLMQLGRNDEALEWFERAITMQPYFGGAYANRGILYDRMGKYELAVADYEKALQLDESVAEGPGWLTRFLRNQPDKPPTVRDRLAYLKAELKKPPAERVLRVPEIDGTQRSYQKDG